MSRVKSVFLDMKSGYCSVGLHAWESLWEGVGERESRQTECVESTKSL